MANNNKQYMVTIDAQYEDVIKTAAMQAGGLPVAGYIRHLVLSDLRARNLVDEQMAPLVPSE